MGIFDFFKAKQAPGKDRLKFKDIDNFIKNKKIDNSRKEKQFLESIRESLPELCRDLESKNEVLKNINLDEKKTDPRAKFIIRENLSHYIELLEKLIRELKELESSSLVDLITDLDSLFIDFETRSKMNFEKATFLIGKELGAVKDTINNFTRNLKRNIDENKSTLENSKILSQIDKRLLDLDGAIKIIDEIDDKIKNNDLKLKTIEASIANTELDIVKLKSSENYKNEISLEAEINIKNEELEKAAYQLKDMIDFKKLANLFHYDSKKMTVINEYKLNFINIFKKDRLLSLVPLLNEANMSDSFITKKTNEIMTKEKEIDKIKSLFNKKESGALSDLNKRLISLRSDEEFTDRENQKEEKRKEKSVKTKQEFMDLLKQDFDNMNVELLVE